MLVGPILAENPAEPHRHEKAVTAALAAIPLAAAVWVVIFAWRPANFWLLMALGTGGLGALALGFRGAFPLREGVHVGDLATGLAATAVLYAVFAGGKVLAGLVLPSAAAQIGAVYLLRAQAQSWVIAILLVLVIGPGEELFWRGLVQWGLVQRGGPVLGWTAATLCYGLVHLAAANALLVVAALVAGAFWGLLYLQIGRIAPLVVSHIAWDLTVFLLLPFQ